MSITTPPPTTAGTGRRHPRGRPSLGDGVAAGVLAAVWCRSVGACWTLELYQLSAATTPGVITDWITSGVPISQPAP